jgi:hypothetical protein
VTGRGVGADGGSSAVELPLGVALILFPVAMVVMVIPQWPERQTVATAAAKEAASLYAGADGAEEGAFAAHAAVDRAAVNYGLPGLRLRLSGAWCRGCTVTAEVTVAIPAVQVPFVGTIGDTSWTASSAARVEDFGSL